LLLLDEIGKLLADNGIGTINTDIFKSFMPDSPNTITTIYETAGSPPQDVMCPTVKVAWENPQIQITCRSTDYQTARNKAEDIYSLLITIANQVLLPSSSASGALYFRITALHSPHSIGQDENARLRVICNYDILKELST
jgi:hypothetical protein